MSSVEKRGGIQTAFSGFGDLASVVPRERRLAQPRIERRKKPEEYELFSRVLDLRFRGEINFWLERLDFPLNEVLTEVEERMARLYLWPQPDRRWLGQSEVAASMGWSERGVKRVSWGVKVAIWKVRRREKIGPEALETLKLPWFSYRGLLEKGIFTWREIPSFNAEEIRRVCGSEFGLELLKEALFQKGIVWEPKVEFPEFPDFSQKI